MLVDDLLIRLACLSPPANYFTRTSHFRELRDEYQIVRPLFQEAEAWSISNELSQLNSESRRLLH